MKKTIDVIKMFLCFAAIAVMSVGCSNTAILAGTETAGITTQTSDFNSEDGYVSVQLQLPENVGRGWDIASYNVTATSGDDVEEFTSKTPNLSVKLKVGKWYFDANAKDEHGNILYSAGSTATIGLKSSQVYIGLLKRIGRLKVQMLIDNEISGSAKPQRYEVKAERGQGFVDVTGDINSIDDTVTLPGLAQGEWTLTCTAYSAPSDDPTGEATVAYYQGTTTVNVEASQTKSVSVALEALKVAPPIFSHSGEVKAGQVVNISSQQSGALVYATTDSKDPKTSATQAVVPANPIYITINDITTVKAAVKVGDKWSDVISKSFTIVAENKCVAPQITPESQTIIGTKYCSIKCEEVGAAIYYTTNGTTPTTSSTLYTDKFVIDRDMTVKAIAVKNGLENSEVVSTTYVYKTLRCAKPTIDPISGTFAPGQKITIAQNTIGSTTYYLISDKDSAVADPAGNDTLSFTNDKLEIDTTSYKAGTYYITALSRIEGREDSEVAKASFTISATNNDDNVIYMCIDNLIVTTQEANMYKEVGTMVTNAEVWYGFTYDVGGNVYIDVEPSSIEKELYKNGTISKANIPLSNNVAGLPKGENYYYLHLKAKTFSSNVRVRIYTTNDPTERILESLSIAAASQSVKVGETTTLTASAYFSDDDSPQSVNPSWNVDDTSIATVSGKTLTAVKEGIVTLTASYTYNGVTKTSNSIKITVTPATPVKTLVKVNVSEASNSTAESPKFTAKAYYTDGSSKDVTSIAPWSSSAPSVATVNKGIVTLVNKGATEITVSYTEGNVTKSGAKQTVTVTKTEATTGMAVYVLADYGEMTPNGNIYAWQGEVKLYGDWPGKQMTKTTDNAACYCIIENPSAIGNLIFNNGNGTQTPNLTMPSAITGHWLAYWNNSKNGWDWKEYDGSAKAPLATGGSGEMTATVVSGDDPDPDPDPDPTTTTTTTTIPPMDGLHIFVKADSAPTIWAWETNSGTALSEKVGESWPGDNMVAAIGMNDGTGWYMKDFSSATLKGTGTISFKLNGKDPELSSGKKATFWYDGSSFYDADPTKKKDPVKPTVTLSPNDGATVKTTGSISVTYTDGYDTISSANITINGTSYSLAPVAGTWSKSLKDLGITTDGVAITVSATVTNGQGTETKSASYTSKYVDPSKEDVFTWDNVNAYFVLTDRFYNGNTSNDHSYGRQRASGDEDVATFHGGDLKGLTQKMDYFKNLGINAIWITAPYEQAHGWVGGKDGKFPHYAFHGYYTLDWSALDQNMGTLTEFRDFVNACHANGIRVIMDVVMNHVGYNNVADMVTYNHGSTPHEATWFAKTNGKWDANDGVQWSNNLWDNSWFGPWIRSFGYDSGSEYGGSCGGLPDVKTELTSSVGLAPVHVTKWKKDSAAIKSAYYNPSVSNVDWNNWSGDFRTDKGVAPAIYQEVWLSAWVREFGIDGFRCDTAKHVEKERWGELKRACQAALVKWRNDDSKSKMYNGVDTGAAEWDENFWMTGEHWGWTSKDGQGDYYTTGGFDSMINFSFNGNNSWDGNYRTNYPSESAWSSYLSINNNGDGDNNGNRNNVLTYISSHDTGLTRVGDQKAVGTGLVLLSGGVQIYYGDESYRPKAYTGCGDGDMYTRGDMNWDNQSCVDHWGKVGQFRKFNPAVGAGKGSATKRSYSGPAGENKIAIGVSGGSVDVSGLFADGTKVYNWYDDNPQPATVSGGKVTFQGGSMTQPILVSEKNPADYK